MSGDEFRRIVRFILERGDRLTYCNMYNCNPHFAFGEVDVFLDPDAGQRNINCDPALSGFDRLTIRVELGPSTYFHVKRTGESVSCERGAEEYVGRILGAVRESGVGT